MEIDRRTNALPVPIQAGKSRMLKKTAYMLPNI